MKTKIDVYEKTYMEINNKLNKFQSKKESRENLPILQNEQNFYTELYDVVRKKDEDISYLKLSYENELKVRNDIYNEKIQEINRKCQEEIKAIRNEYENKINCIIKQAEEEKADFIKCQESMSQNNDLENFQKKYLHEMKALQEGFECFKQRTYEEFKSIKKQKEDIYGDLCYYKSQNQILIDELNLYKENILSLQKVNERIKKVKYTYLG
jgi:DNA repair exonuclease SbcCD nuclease subunit